MFLVEKTPNDIRTLLTSCLRTCTLAYEPRLDVLCPRVVLLRSTISPDSLSGFLLNKSLGNAVICSVAVSLPCGHLGSCWKKVLHLSPVSKLLSLSSLGLLQGGFERSTTADRNCNAWWWKWGDVGVLVSTSCGWRRYGWSGSLPAISGVTRTAGLVATMYLYPPFVTGSLLSTGGWAAFSFGNW